MARSDRTRGILDTLNTGDLPGIHFSAAEFDRLIVRHGNSGELRRNIICPCIRIDPRVPVANCVHCKGIGWIYPPPMREPLIFLDQQRAATLKLASAGVLVDGTVQITFPSGIIPGFGDMLLPDGEEHVVIELLFRDGSRRVTDENLREFRISPDQVKPALKPRTERLLYPTTCCVEHVTYEVGSGRDARLAVANPSEYHVDTDGRWTWREGAGPAAGHGWTVRYRAPAVYVVHTAVPRYRSEADQRMQHLVTAKRLDKIAHEDLRT